MGYATNTLKTVIFIALLTALVLWIGQLVGGASGLVIAFVFALVMNGAMYWFSDKIVLWMYRAKELPASHRAAKMVREIAEKARLPVPRTYIVENQNPNAFATGRNPKHAAVAVTSGILDLLNDEELRGVIAHEMSHVKNRDTLITTIAGVLAGIISYVANMAQWAAIFGGGNDREDGSNLVQLLVLAIITPIIAAMLQMAISRAREYMADESAAKMLNNGQGLANALRKLERGNKSHPIDQGAPATGSLFIVNPFKGSFWLNMLSTHPPIEKRVARLEQMSF